MDSIFSSKPAKRKASSKVQIENAQKKAKQMKKVEKLESFQLIPKKAKKKQPQTEGNREEEVANHEDDTMGLPSLPTAVGNDAGDGDKAAKKKKKKKKKRKNKSAAPASPGALVMKEKSSLNDFESNPYLGMDVQLC